MSIPEPRFVVIVQNDSRKKFNLAIGPFDSRRAADFFLAQPHVQRDPGRYRVVPLMSNGSPGPVLDVTEDWWSNNP